jgi:hypothetical protein
MDPVLSDWIAPITTFLSVVEVVVSECPLLDRQA